MWTDNQQPGSSSDSLHDWVERMAPGALQLARYASRHSGPGIVTMQIIEDGPWNAVIKPGFLTSDQLAGLLPSTETSFDWELWDEPVAGPDDGVPFLISRAARASEHLLVTLCPAAVEAAWRERALSWAPSPLGATLYDALPQLWLAYAEHGRGLPCLRLPAFPTVDSPRAVSYLPLARWDDPTIDLPASIRHDCYARRRVATFDPAGEILALVFEEDMTTGKLRPDLVSLPLDEDAGAIGCFMLRLGTSGLGEHEIPLHGGRWN